MLTSIHLRLIRENHLAHLLSVTRALTTLRWDWYYCPEPPSSHAGSPSLINLDKLAVDLTRLRLTLREPIIGTQSTLGQGLEILFLDVRGSLQDINGFPYFEKLEIPLPFLMASFAS